MNCTVKLAFTVKPTPKSACLTPIKRPPLLKRTLKETHLTIKIPNSISKSVTLYYETCLNVPNYIMLLILTFP